MCLRERWARGKEKEAKRVRYLEKSVSVRSCKRYEKFPFHLDGLRRIRFGSHPVVEFRSVLMLGCSQRAVREGSCSCRKHRTSGRANNKHVGIWGHKVIHPRMTFHMT